MKPGVTAIERAFQLARSGSVRNIRDIKKALKREGYSLEPIEGRTLNRQLNKIIEAERESASPSGTVPVDNFNTRNDE